MARVVLLIAALALLGGCAAQPAHWSGARTYTVEPGDTMYSIAFRHGIDWRDLARWNGIEAPRYLIRPGQVLSLSGEAAPRTTSSAPSTPAPTRPTPQTVPAPSRPSPAATAAATSGVTFRWPAAGAVDASGKGITIAGRAGDAIVAAAAGRVVYVGSGLVGYGQLIIVKHNNQLLSAYAHNREILVQEGDEVRAGQRIATMGEGPGRRAMLHFEIRIDGAAVDPLQHLPPR